MKDAPAGIPLVPFNGYWHSLKDMERGWRYPHINNMPTDTLLTNRRLMISHMVLTGTADDRMLDILLEWVQELKRRHVEIRPACIPSLKQYLRETQTPVKSPQ